ncbi:hypothetical protein PVK06_035976 [Gossypium arboreum]|uniref:Reverse transcriptase n=1 Tax=Gossypium arboreum TaxID=29729 RepID=A0ABR0NKE4_GOSAR|nr:hypothetical protein PVK06_035976 [Gossypium arboreum]
MSRHRLRVSRYTPKDGYRGTSWLRYDTGPVFILWTLVRSKVVNNILKVLYKIIAKVLTNRLKDTLLKSISQNQSAFVLRQMIHDNILITYGLVHYLQSIKNGPNKGFVIKLDMSKAYDLVE